MIYKELTVDGYEEIQAKYNVDELVAKVLVSKQLDDQTILELLSDTKTTNDFDLSFLDDIILRIQQAKQNQEKIMICGDYDCDGVCATTILYDALTRFGCVCGYYIPDRFEEGYGVSLKTVEMAVEKGYTLLITVDNGVKATQELTYAKEHGMCVILSDHHSYEEKDLVYDYFLHPNILPVFYGKLCGAGLAYLLSKRLIGNDPYHTVLVSIATIGDMVGVLDANRVIIKEGIALLKTMEFTPITLLSDTSNHWDATKIAFQIVPKINALGRLADQANVNVLVRYLLMRDYPSLKKVASQINKLNDTRKKISAENEKLALSKVNESHSFIVVSDDAFHEGLNGVVAAKIANKYQRPAMVLSNKDGILKGSIRSVGVDMTSFFDEYTGTLLAYGGHKQAAGISLEEQELDTLINYTQAQFDKCFKEEQQSYLTIDKRELSIQSLAALDCLEPFGVDFTKPKFMIHDSELEFTTLSNGLHLKMKSDKLEYLYFQHGSLLSSLANKPLTIIGELGINVFRNKKSINMIVDDVLK